SLDTPSIEVVRMSLGADGLAKFEECLQRLERIVQELEKGDAPLEKSLTLFEEGMQLSATCRKELEEAEGKVEILLKQNGKLHAVTFEPHSEKSPAGRSPDGDSGCSLDVMPVVSRSPSTEGVSHCR